MGSFSDEYTPIKKVSMIALQDAITEAISDLTKSKYFCKIDKIEFMDWNKASIKLTLDGSEAIIENMASDVEEG